MGPFESRHLMGRSRSLSFLLSQSINPSCHTQPLSACVCVSGESEAAVQINLHHGRAGAQRERQSRTVSASGEMGEPIAFKHNHNLTDFLLSDSPPPPKLTPAETFFLCSHVVLSLTGIDCVPLITLMRSQCNVCTLCYNKSRVQVQSAVCGCLNKPATAASQLLQLLFFFLSLFFLNTVLQRK